MTIVGRVAARMLEGLWLAAVAFTPLFFNVYSSRVFEPDKVALFRSLMFFAALCWLVKLIEQRSYRPAEGEMVAKQPKGEQWWRRPLLVPLLLLAGWLLIASLAGVNPGLSIFGSYQRAGGAISDWCYIFLAIVLLGNLRTQAQVERLITFAIASGVPVALYGYLQHYKADPLPWAGDVSEQTGSTFGNPTYQAAWLIMLLPLVLYRAATLWRRLQTEPLERSSSDPLRLLCYGLVAAAQQLILWFALLLVAANQRPDFGLWFIMPVAILLFYLLNFVYGTASSHSWLLTLAQLVLMIGLLPALLLAIYFTGSPVPLVAGLVGIGCFFGLAFLSQSQRGLAVSSAVLAVVAVGVFVAKLPAQFSGGTRWESKWLIWQGAIDLLAHSSPPRLLLGHGPETTYLIYSPYYPLALPHLTLRNSTPDRSHSAYLEMLLNGGLPLLLLYLLLVGTFLWHAWRLTLGSATFERRMLVAALVGGVAAHLIQIATLHPVASTAVYFYTYLALALASYYVPEWAAVVEGAAGWLVPQTGYTSTFKLAGWLVSSNISPCGTVVIWPNSLSSIL